MATRYYFTHNDVVKQRYVNQRVLGDHSYVRHERRRRGKIPRRGTGGSSTGTSETIRAFEAIEYKRSDDVDLIVAWLDFRNEPTGETGTVYDFDRKFHAVPDGYLLWPQGTGTGTGDDLPLPGSRGLAALRDNDGPAGTGTGENLSQRWEIIDVETWAKFIVAEYVGGDSSDPDPRKKEDWFSFSGIYRDSESFSDWARLYPQIEEEPIRSGDFVGTPFLVEPIIGDVVLMMLVDANGFPDDEIPEGWEDQPWAPAYIPVAVFERNQIIYVGTGAGAGLVTKIGDAFPGRVANQVGVIPAFANTDEACWITDLSDSEILTQGTFYLGRFVGLYDPDPEGESNELPRYAIKHHSGAENYRAIRAKSTSLYVSADDSFIIADNIVPLAGGLDPRSNPFNPSETIIIYKLQDEEIPPNTNITAVYSPGIYSGAAPNGEWEGNQTINWELVVVERPRLIRGAFTGTYDDDDDIIFINSIESLASGEDPRLDPTDGEEEIAVKLVGQDFTGTIGDIVYAAFNYGIDTGVDWEALPLDTDRFLAVDDDDDRPDELFPKIQDHSTFNAEDHQVVYAQVVPDPAPSALFGSYNKIRFFTDMAEPGGGGTGTSDVQVYVCTLEQVVEAGNLSEVGVGTGNIFRVSQEGSLITVGTGVIFNPFRMILPVAGAGDVITYPILRTHGSSSANYRYTVTGLDILHILASLFGFDRKKVLFVPDGEGSPSETEIGWYGQPCGTGS